MLRAPPERLPPPRGRPGPAPRAGRCAGTLGAARPAARPAPRPGPGSCRAATTRLTSPIRSASSAADRTAGEDQVHRPARPRSAGAAAPCRRRSAARPSAGRRRRTPRRSATTRRSHQSASSSPPATAWPSIGGDHRLAEPHPGRAPSARRRPASTRLPRSVPIALRSAPAQNVPPVAVQHRDALVVVGVELPERVGERRGGRAVDRVAGLRPVEDDGGDRAGLVDAHAHDRKLAPVAHRGARPGRRLAVAEGFEPSVGLHPQTLSRRSP